MGLESLVKKAEKFQAKKLINGDTLKGVFSDGSSDKKFFATEQGDFWYVEAGRAFQVNYRHNPLPPETSVFVARDKYNPKQVLTNLETLSQLLENKSFLGDETKRFDNQLVRFAEQYEAVVVEKELLDDVIKSYRPTNSSVAPFGRYASNRELFKKMQDKGKTKVMHRPMVNQDAYFIDVITSLVQDKHLPRPRTKEQKAIKRTLLQAAKNDKESINVFARKIVEDYVVGRKVPIEKGLLSFARYHGFNNGNGGDEQMYDSKIKRQHWQFFLNDDRPLLIDLEKGVNDYSYTRSLEKKSFGDVVNGVYAGVQRRFGKAKDFVRRKAAPLLLAGLIASNVGSYFLWSGRDKAQERERLEHVVKEPIPTFKAPIIEKKIIHTQEEYVVEKGDCLWNIAKNYVDKQDNSVVFEKTNEIAVENDMLTIDEYAAKKEQNEYVSKQKNPHLIYPGDTINVSVEKEITREVFVENSIDDVVTQPVQEERQEARNDSIDRVLYTPPEQPRASEQYVPETTAVIHERKQVEQPVSYVGVLQDVVKMKNDGASLQSISEKYTGFRNQAELQKAFSDYQGFVQSGMISEPETIMRYDKRIASDDFKQRIVHEYQRGNETLKDIRQNLREEYGMDVSESTISKYARQELGVKNRKESRSAS